MHMTTSDTTHKRKCNENKVACTMSKMTLPTGMRYASVTAGQLQSPGLCPRDFVHVFEKEKGRGERNKPSITHEKTNEMFMVKAKICQLSLHRHPNEQWMCANIYFKDENKYKTASILTWNLCTIASI